MHILFIGGSRFVGKHAVLEAQRRGHTVTLFNRGNQPLPTPGTRHIRGDRNSDLSLLAGERFDAVIDTSAYVPRQVRSASEALAGSTDAYLFISSVSVYENMHIPFQDESAPLAELEDPRVEDVTGETYGGLKVLCERALAESFPGRKVVVRPGVVVGPDDPTDRFTYWPVRVRRGGEVLAPRGPELPMQWIDARDLATWTIGLLENGLEGTYNAVSEPDRFTLGGLVEAARRVTGSTADPVWVDEEFLLQNGVRPFRDLPLWLAGEAANFSRVDASRAYASGLAIRPAEDSIRDTLVWFDDQRRTELQAGLDPERERELLADWKATSAA